MKTLSALVLLLALSSHANAAESCPFTGSQAVACDAWRKSEALRTPHALPDSVITDKAAHAIDSLVRIESCLRHEKKSQEGGGAAVDCGTIIARSGYAKR